MSCVLLGLDEVGRGAGCGPLVVAAVAIPEDIRERLGPLGRFLRDSKTVSEPKRQAVVAELRHHASLIDLESISAAEINERGIQWANSEAFRRLILRHEALQYVVDGSLALNLPRSHATRTKMMERADALVPAVAAASLVAKVSRDTMLVALIDEHPEWAVYGWERNKGYLTADHIAALREHGSCSEHRTQFVRTALSPRP